MAASGLIRPLEREKLRERFATATPYPFIAIDGFLDEAFATQVATSYPTFENAERIGFEFNFVNEQRKVQVTDVSKFPDPVARLNEALAAPSFLADLSYITGIPELLADAKLRGGGMHLTGAGGRLDVHVDFNYFEEDRLHRRLNILIYLNQEWDAEWGGEIELWDQTVTNLGQSFKPTFNRCVIFATSDISYHGVRPVRCPPHVARRSFAAYYYTEAAPAHWKGETHSTIFRARPDEFWRGTLLMPVERIQKRVTAKLRSAQRRLRGWIER